MYCKMYLNLDVISRLGSKILKKSFKNCNIRLYCGISASSFRVGRKFFFSDQISHTFYLWHHLQVWDQKMVCTYVIYVSTVMPAAEATFMIRPPWPPFVWPILSIAVNTPRTAPINMTSKFFSQPCYIM